MAVAEKKRPDGVDVVMVATPNDSHFDIAKRVSRGRHLGGLRKTAHPGLRKTSAALISIAESTGAILAVPHCYSAYAMVRHAARMVRDGSLGAIRLGVRRARLRVGVDRHWNSETIVRPAGAWIPTSPDYPSVVADLGTHAFHLLRYVTGLEATQGVGGTQRPWCPGGGCSTTPRSGLSLSNGAPATLWASMAATGNEHGLRIRVFGEEAGIEWRHEDPHHLVIRDKDGGTTTLAQGMTSLSEDAARLTRPGLGHPEGFLEAFANFYADLADMLRARRDGRPAPTRELSIPTGVDGLIGVQFVEAAEASHALDGAWVEPQSVRAQVGV